MVTWDDLKALLLSEKDHFPWWNENGDMHIDRAWVWDSGGNFVSLCALLVCFLFPTRVH